MEENVEEEMGRGGRRKPNREAMAEIGRAHV